ncbi:hypothetical protein FAES_5119 [Fibrella aestuarina BUZ 2]|uniref:Uncharacterized protein n=1 Tax=Fibrella aestuarina BUZ 2 TaxID=1166018 RepID=I0KG65_9BACT|nr:hypothetical protein FAES_5119 [Fibrella aestuarina BUZ 2]
MVGLQFRHGPPQLATYLRQLVPIRVEYPPADPSVLCRQCTLATTKQTDY